MQPPTMVSRRGYESMIIHAGRLIHTLLGGIVPASGIEPGSVTTPNTTFVTFCPAPPPKYLAATALDAGIIPGMGFLWRM